MRLILALLVCLLTASCISALPDEVHVFYGRGWGDSNFDKRNTDFHTDSENVTVGGTWKLDKIKDPGFQDTEKQYAALQALQREVADLKDEQVRPVPEVVVCCPARAPEPAPSCEPETTPSPTPEVTPVPPEKPKEERSRPVTLTALTGQAQEYFWYALATLALAIAAIMKRKLIGRGYRRVRHGKAHTAKPETPARP